MLAQSVAAQVRPAAPGSSRPAGFASAGVKSSADATPCPETPGAFWTHGQTRFEQSFRLRGYEVTPMQKATMVTVANLLQASLYGCGHGQKREAAWCGHGQKGVCLVGLWERGRVLGVAMDKKGDCLVGLWAREGGAWCGHGQKGVCLVGLWERGRVLGVAMDKKGGCLVGLWAREREGALCGHGLEREARRLWILDGGWATSCCWPGSRALKSFVDGARQLGGFSKLACSSSAAMLLSFWHAHGVGPWRGPLLSFYWQLRPTGGR
eukprot:365104-Chlamydomonas_euryale.AAC.7